MTSFTLVSVETSKLFHFLFKAACISTSVALQSQNDYVHTKNEKNLKIVWQMIL